MAEFKVKTKGGSIPKGKPRVYFTCHPDDFDKYFDKICEDVFKTHDCAIYYTADMTEAFDETNMDVDLGQMNLFLVPVTFRLMNEPCRAMQVDIGFAKANNIAILPFMIDSGIDDVYSMPENFGERQYLSPFSQDITQIGYEEKLKRVLESVLISDETVKRVRAAFDAYIFLSYRKKDRKYANELMKIIHSIPLFENVAIWYDEFLTPGESYLKNIEQAIESSDLFALLVTPNIFEEGNFVMCEEYPAAIKLKKEILPIETVPTDYEELRAKFPGIRKPVRIVENKLYQMISDHEDPIRNIDENLFNALFGLVLMSPNHENEDEHTFLIGLAYLDGIDVEVDVERGVELITHAADRGYPDAMEKLYHMYTSGDSVPLNYGEALKWAQRLLNYYFDKYGVNHPVTLACAHNLASAYNNVGDHIGALELNEMVYKLYCKNLGEDHPATLKSLNNLAFSYRNAGKHQKALEFNERCYELRLKVLGEDDPYTLNSLNNLAHAYLTVGEEEKALEMFKKAYFSMSEVLGVDHPTTLQVNKNLNYLLNKLLW